MRICMENNPKHLEYNFKELKKMAKEASSKEAKLSLYGYILSLMHLEVVTIKECEELFDVLDVPKNDLEKMVFR